MVKQLTKDVSAVTMKAGEKISALTASLERVGKEVEGARKE